MSWALRTLRSNISVNPDALRRPIASVPPLQIAGYLQASQGDAT